MSREEVLDALRDRVDPETGPVATAPEIADDLPLTRRSVLDKLRLLEAAGEVGCKSVGARAAVWWPLPSKEPSRGPSRENQGTASDPSKEPTTEATREPEADGDPDLVEALEGWPEPRASKREQRRAAGLATLRWLRGRGETGGKRSEVVDGVEPEQPVDGQGKDTWWRKSARPALQKARDAGFVEFEDGTKIWRWAGE